MHHNQVDAWHVPTLDLLECDDATIFDKSNVYLDREAVKSLRRDTFGAAPDCAAMIFLGADDKRIVVLSKNAMKDFLKKLFINEKARGVAEVYPPGLSISDEDITKHFSTVKINVEYEPRTEISVSQDISSSIISRGPR